MDLGWTEHGDQRSRTRRGMQGMGELQDHDRGGDGQCRSETHMRTKQLVRGHTDGGGDQLADEQVAGLGEVGVWRPVQQRCGGAEGTYEEEPRGEREIGVQARDRDQEDPDGGGGKAQ